MEKNVLERAAPGQIFDAIVAAPTIDSFLAEKDLDEAMVVSAARRWES